MDAHTLTHPVTDSRAGAGSALTAQETATHWRTMPAPHAAEDADAPRLAPAHPDIPRGSSGMVCCGTNWGTRPEADIHRSAVHH